MSGVREDGFAEALGAKRLKKRITESLERLAIGCSAARASLCTDVVTESQNDSAKGRSHSARHTCLSGCGGSRQRDDGVAQKTSCCWAKQGVPSRTHPRRSRFATETGLMSNVSETRIRVA